MSTKKSIAASGVIAAVAATTIIVFAMFTGLPLGPTTTSSSSSSPLTSTTSPAKQGVLSILLTDPPNVPNGVTKVYVTYSNLAVHVSEAGNESGWSQVREQGTIELMSTVNVSQTISSVKITSGDYNLIRLNLTGALVTYNGKNYTALVPSSKLTIPIKDGIEVNDSKPSATIIDITPTVVNIGSNSNPEFIIRPIARAYPIPSSQVTEDIEHNGSRKSLVGLGWWNAIRQKYTANLHIKSASLNANSLSVTVNNTGTDETILRLVTITPLANAILGQTKLGSDDRRNHIPTELFRSAIFVVLQNGTVVPIQKFIHDQRVDARALASNLYKQSGFNLSSGATTTIAYHGSIILGFAQLNAKLPTGQIVAGQQYLVTVLGDKALASSVVTAS